jgi:S-adenosylmethionine/arginine decarboxylase-like enzyme
MMNPILRTTQVNIYDCVHPLMCDEKEMNIFLSKLVEFIGMTIIPENLVGQKNPNSFLCNPDTKPVEEHGISGCVILFESHIVAHSWYDSNFLNVVITSCKEYDPRTTALWIVGYTGSRDFRYDTISF